MVLSFGWSSGWSTINAEQLGNKTDEFPVGNLSDMERSLIISFSFGGSFTGTCIVVPISELFGIKRTIHLFGMSLIVSVCEIQMCILFKIKTIHSRLVRFFFSSHKMFIIYMHRDFFVV